MAEGSKMFTVEIITPERIFYTGMASMVEFTTTEGAIGVYPEHIPLTTVLAPGEVIIHENNGDKIAAIHSGFAEILGDKVTILAEVAEWPEEIDLARAESAKERAEELLQKKMPNTDLIRAELALRRALVRIDVSKK